MNVPWKFNKFSDQACCDFFVNEKGTGHWASYHGVVDSEI